MTEAGKLRVDLQPENKLAYTNRVFVHPVFLSTLTKSLPLSQEASSSERNLTYVSIAGHVFIVEAHPNMQVDGIGLNKLQRESCGVESGDWVTPALYRLPLHEPSFHLHAARVEFQVYDESSTLSKQIYGNPRIIPKRLNFREEEMLPILKESWSGQVLTRGQWMWGKFGQWTMMYQIKSLDAAAADVKHIIIKSVPSGLFSSQNTKVKLQSGSPFLTLEESNELPPLFDPGWSFADMGIGGLDLEFNHIFRRAFASRLFPPQVIEQLGIKHVKGLLLYGPPGTGKTLIARQIGKLLKGQPPKIVNGPEVLDKFVGMSEAKIRDLFADAEKDQDNKKSGGLHIIIFDELDAICKTRGTVSNGTGVHDTVVNQLLSKIDGVHSLNNVLIIGMTNRKDMIDPALLRPGRLEVHVEIGLPDEKGREQILHIHTKTMCDHKKLAADVDLVRLAELTKNFSGAELEGLVKSAVSFAMYGAVDVKNPADFKVEAEKIVVHMSHFEKALTEVIAAFGSSDDILQSLTKGLLVVFSDQVEKLQNLAQTWIRQVRDSQSTPLLTVLLAGEPGSGQTACAAQLALDAKFPFTRVISPESLLHLTESGRCDHVIKVFEDAYKSPLSCIILDNVERLLEYVPVGPRFNNSMLQTLCVLLRRRPPSPNRRLLVLATTASAGMLKSLDMLKEFDVFQRMPTLMESRHVKIVLASLKPAIDVWEIETASQAAIKILPLGIKSFLLMVEMAKTLDDNRRFLAKHLEQTISNMITSSAK